MEYPSGTLTLRFAHDSEGARALAARVAEDDGASLSGAMTVTVSGIATTYDCGYMAHNGQSYEFVFSCLR
jgi:hypothetical protein